MTNNSFIQPNVYRVFTKIGSAQEISKALQAVGILADVVNTQNVAKVIFLADSLEQVRGPLKAVGVVQCEVFDANTTEWSSQNPPDKYFLKVTL